MSQSSTTHRALVQNVYTQPLSVENRTTPTAAPGTAILRIEVASVISYQKEVYNGTRKYPYPTPFVPGLHAIGRVEQIGPDAVLLERGDLVLFEPFIRARDNPTTTILSGLSDLGTGQKLMQGEWRDSTYAQYARVPLENCQRLNEATLCRSLAEGGMGYSLEQLSWIGMGLVGYGGLRSVSLQAGETVIVAPATGPFGGAAALVAAAMGARVLAMGRNAEKLAHLKKLSPRIHTIPMSSDEEEEKRLLAEFGQADVYLDLAPPQATPANSTFFKSALKSLRRHGRVSLMGGQGGELAIPAFHLVGNSITICAQRMYDRNVVRDYVKLVETGCLSLSGICVAGRFDLEDWEKAFDTAATMRLDEVTVLSGW